MVLNNNQFAKDYKKYSYNKTHLIGKKLKGQKPSRNIEKTFIPRNMWNLKF
jgi:hypothetical protein